MTSLFHTTLLAQTAPFSGADLGVRAGRVGSAAGSMRGCAVARIASADAANDLHALAVRGAG
jgi:hypothetical protein